MDNERCREDELSHVEWNWIQIRWEVFSVTRLVRPLRADRLLQSDLVLQI